MRRREFIAGIGSAAAWPLVALAQQGERVRRVGVLTWGLDAPVNRSALSILRDDLEQLGWSEGRNLRLDFRFGDGDARKTIAFAADLVQLAPDVIVTVYFAAFWAVQQETKTIPIVVCGVGDLGTVINTARPEGNVTGFTNAFASLGGKWLELLKEVAPNITRVGFIHHALNIYPLVNGYGPSIATAAQSLGVHLVPIPVRDVASAKAAIEGFAAQPNGGLIPNPALLHTTLPADELNRLTLQFRLPSVYGLPVGGGLMSYSNDIVELYRGAATYLDRLLRGAKVSDLPIQYPTKFRLVINLKTAKAIGLTVPNSLQLLADRVIDE
jgi:putative tryptophan/tyrosine transport system substrate-binding protein